MNAQQVKVDAVVIGGGVAGLWLLDELCRRGFSGLLLEKGELGKGQTVGSQGIIHGGLKYMFDGNLNTSARAISEMPVIWREAIAGQREPDLRGTNVRSNYCYIWGTGSIQSRIFMAGSKIALRAAPEPVEKGDWPAALKNVPGKVMRVPEQVVDVPSMVRRFVEKNPGRILRSSDLEFEKDQGGQVRKVRVSSAGEMLDIQCSTVILTAGEGNEALRQSLGLAPGVMQRRPLHMVMVRGDLRALFGHCVGGPKPRITITSARDSQGRMVYQVGGQIAEDAVKMSEAELFSHARNEIEGCVPGIDLRNAEFASYRVNRAEAATTSGQRPEDVHLVREENIITAWPTKLALAPRLAERVIEELKGSGIRAQGLEQPMLKWKAPAIAPPPWEESLNWSGASS